jgi:hypothetical protein
MEKPFNCLVCSQFVDPLYSHSACSKTCGSSECQAIYSKLMLCPNYESSHIVKNCRTHTGKQNF